MDPRHDRPSAGSQTAFYTISSASYFPGLVGLVNSLRTVGHRETIFVADVGMTERQRALLEPHCRLVPLSRNDVASALQYKPFAHLLNPQGIVFILDSDMIATRNLTPMIEMAAQGRIVVFPDPEPKVSPNREYVRRFAEWQDIFGTTNPPRTERQSYVNSGFVVFDAAQYPDLLSKWWDACGRIRDQPTYQERAEGPTRDADQAALNALLMSDFPAEPIRYLSFSEQACRWDLPRVAVIDPQTLQCRWMGRQPSILHASLVPKPWETPGFRRNVYTIFLRRLLNGPDVAIKVPPELLPVCLRPGRSGDLAASALHLANTLNRDDGAQVLVSTLRKIKRAAQITLGQKHVGAS